MHIKPNRTETFNCCMIHSRISVLSVLILSLTAIFNASAQDEREVNANYFFQLPVYKRIFYPLLNNLPALQAEIKDSTSLNGYLLLTTHNTSVTDKSKSLSLQLIDTRHPYPPLWFCNMLPHEEAQLTDCKQQPNGNLSFYIKTDNVAFSNSKKDTAQRGRLSGYLQLNDKLEPVEFFSTANMNNHDYKALPGGERIVLSPMPARIENLSMYKIQGVNVSENCVVNTEGIKIYNRKNQLVFSWNPLDHMSVHEMYFDRYDTIIQHEPNLASINFSRINSVAVDPADGNLLISLRRSDVCIKVNRTTGKIEWRLGGKKSDFYLPDSIAFYLQHDFKKIESGPYAGCFSVFNNGNANYPSSEGLIYKLDEEQMMVRLVARIKTAKEVNSKGQGNFEVYSDSTMLINFGNNDFNEGDRQKPALALFKNGEEIATYYTPASTIIYRAIWLKDLPFHIPELRFTSDTLGYLPVAEPQYGKVYWERTEPTQNKFPTPKLGWHYFTPYGIGFAVSRAVEKQPQTTLSPNFIWKYKLLGALDPTVAEKPYYSKQPNRLHLRLNDFVWKLNHCNIDLNKGFLLAKP